MFDDETQDVDQVQVSRSPSLAPTEVRRAQDSAWQKQQVQVSEDLARIKQAAQGQHEHQHAQREALEDSIKKRAKAQTERKSAELMKKWAEEANSEEFFRMAEEAEKKAAKAEKKAAKASHKHFKLMSSSDTSSPPEPIVITSSDGPSSSLIVVPSSLLGPVSDPDPVGNGGRRSSGKGDERSSTKKKEKSVGKHVAKPNQKAMETSKRSKDKAAEMPVEKSVEKSKRSKERAKAKADNQMEKENDCVGRVLSNASGDIVNYASRAGKPLSMTSGAVRVGLSRPKSVTSVPNSNTPTSSASKPSPAAKPTSAINSAATTSSASGSASKHSSNVKSGNKRGPSPAPSVASSQGSKKRAALVTTQRNEAKARLLAKDHEKYASSNSKSLSTEDMFAHEDSAINSKFSGLTSSNPMSTAKPASGVVAPNPSSMSDGRKAPVHSAASTQLSVSTQQQQQQTHLRGVLPLKIVAMGVS
ncbi:hypothetical protein SAICODRAFT_6489 [Saitoella complicata NRRL Y-17804]|uniref:uncharacterized protein n=1 Tax=Saitoella complicata (strain BCRC 22490 / CBS 7301 / JCM 7358 / NBRC 10748 / NRRL Y-17804) TaxID=698492 RepID=UPI000866F167|nr:uncharacterized protein SAICODRAFT_6489 [Saitoella complicata NRRL Y-17804]ODQ54202.1 hypothetical protein SAICODRAFT_6489 [Saitoella complicata NRRL Y-17804]